MDFSTYLNTLKQKGNLAYEYNPLYNYQTNEDLYIIDNKYIIPSNKAVNIKNGEILTLKNISNEQVWIDKRNNIIPEENIKTAREGDLWAKAGSLIDLDTEQLNFDLKHPVEIEIQPSYDGSVNIILNDDKNIPRLINSRFSVKEKDTYEIIDRIGENDTNIYNSKTFDKDTSLYFQYEDNPSVFYIGYSKGTLLVGQYCFYFTYCDSDDNESDYIAETGLIPVFIGDDRDPRSMDGGIKNQNSNKGIQLKLTDIDKSYNYLKVYYVRYFADYQQNRVCECKKIYKKFPITSNTLYLQITGYEEAEDLDPNILNISRFNPKNILTQAQCKNMLFFGNIVKNSDNYKELTDLALRIIPQLEVVSNFESIDQNYFSNFGDDYAYYNSKNIYSKVGYFNQEYYRFGVVFIYNNGTLSNVYNTLGGVLEKNSELRLSGKLYKQNKAFLSRNYIKIDDRGWIKEDKELYDIKGSQINAKGVCLFNYTESYTDNTIFSVRFEVPKEVSQYLKEELGIRGLFFVRQKCVPNIIAQCYLLRLDDLLQAPILETGNINKRYYSECFLNNTSYTNKHNEGIKTLQLDNNYKDRLYEYGGSDFLNISKKAYAGICPDFILNQPYYNQIFNGGKFRLQKVSQNSYLSNDDSNERFYIENSDVEYNINNGYSKVTICSVTDDVPTVAIKDKTYRLEIGKTEEAYRFRWAGTDNGTYESGKTSQFYEISYDKEGNVKEVKYNKEGSPVTKANQAANLVRGKYSPYLAIYTESPNLETGCLYNIYKDISVGMSQEFQNRMDSSEPFYAISDRYNLITQNKKYLCWRGDCYINQYTHRLNRNFNDPSLPNNDEIVDKNTWRKNYVISNPEKWKDIIRSDVNAVKLGSWITFKVRSAMNYALRSVDHSYVSEEALMGAPRSFFPRSYLLEKGENKLPDSYLYNDAYRASLGYKCYFTLQDVNYIKDTFSNRIQYSAIAIQDSYKNNYRYSLSTYFRDYSSEYGSIQKLLEVNGDLLVIFEHGIGIAKINERILAGGGENDPVFVNSKNVLPEELIILSDTYGTQWGDSVIKSDAGLVYGVDTTTKKIWRVKGQQLELLSDFKVNKFLINNISLEERELSPIIGIRNVKTHYNANKQDIIFTFYDDVYKDEEKAWSLCYNEILNQFITFYSWIPSYSANIDTKFFTFNRDTAKQLALLQKSNYSIPENTGVLIDNPVLKENNLEEGVNLYYVSPESTCKATYTIFNSDGTTSEKSININTKENNGMYVIKDVSFKLEKDHWKNYKLFDIEEIEETINDEITKRVKLIPKSKSINKVKKILDYQKVILLYITPYITEATQSALFQTELVALTLDSILENPLLTTEEKNRAGLTTDFYLHGQAGIFDVAENLYPTYWYGEYHPFEFEFVVNDKIGQQKLFENLIIISNKAEPESFHFEIEGDNYEFSSDKRNMYFRQEATKNLFQNLGSDILYNRKYTDVAANKYTQETYYRPKTNGEIIHITGSDNTEFRFKPIYENYPIHYHDGLVQQVKSTIFPLYYERIDTYNDIYHKYHLMHSNDMTYDFQNLSGSEIVWDRDLNQFNIVTHIKNNQIDLVGRLRGNSRYREGRWNIQIPSISFMQKNEDEWPTVSFYNQTEEELEVNHLTEDGPLKEAGNSYKIPPIVINSQYVPNDLDKNKLEIEDLPNIYTGRLNYTEDYMNYQDPQGNYITENHTEISPAKYVNTSSWTYRKETNIRDKWMKVRIRYSGKNLAIIHSVATLYNLSYS